MFFFFFFFQAEDGIRDYKVTGVQTCALPIYLSNEANTKYVSDFRKKYGYTPAFYGAQSYDGVMLIDAGVRAVKGDLANKAGMIAAMRKADYKSTRGPYKDNLNHFPIQNFYLLKTVRTPEGEIAMQIQKTVFENHKDAYAKDCGMQW